MTHTNEIITALITQSIFLIRNQLMVRNQTIFLNFNLQVNFIS